MVIEEGNLKLLFCFFFPLDFRSFYPFHIFMYFCNNDKGKGILASEGRRLHLPQSQGAEMKPEITTEGSQIKSQLLPKINQNVPRSFIQDHSHSQQPPADDTTLLHNHTLSQILFLPYIATSPFTDST